MRESIGSTWIFSLIITFTLIFTGFLALALTYSKAYKIKNEMVTILEKYEGLTTSDSGGNSISGSLNIINTFLKNNSYNATGSCYNADEINVYGVESLDNTTPQKAVKNKKYLYCISYNTVKTKTKCSASFNVKVFFNFNLPVLGYLGKFSVEGHTNEIYHARFINKQLCK